MLPYPNIPLHIEVNWEAQILTSSVLVELTLFDGRRLEYLSHPSYVPIYAPSCYQGNVELARTR